MLIMRLCLFDFDVFVFFLSWIFAAFSEGMADDGYENVVNIDISSVVIDTMQKRYANRPQLKCICLISLCIFC